MFLALLGEITRAHAQRTPDRPSRVHLATSILATSSSSFAPSCSSKKERATAAKVRRS
jgi:hypothetical protein